MEACKYQYGFSEHYPGLYKEVRELKGKKALAVLEDHFSGKLKDLSVLDIGCSTGIMANILSKRVAKVVGIDIDEKAVEYGQKNFKADNLELKIGDSMNLEYEDSSFNIVICTQVYEHVPDSNKLLFEIYRVLKPGGVCFFSAGNRLSLIEAHYHLPFLSIIPKPMAHLYLRLLKKGRYYYENHLTLWGLMELVNKFDIKDYTLKIISDPEKYCANDSVKPGTSKQKVAIAVCRWAYWLFPNYVWLLCKK